MPDRRLRPVGWVLGAAVTGLALAAANAPAKPRLVAAPQRVPAADDTRIAIPGARAGQIRSVLNVPDRMYYGAYLWEDRDVPAGKVWVRIDRDAQILSVFRGGHEIGTAVILYGAPEKPTPPGRYPILAKYRHHRSSLYEADMPYTLRLTHDGISVHGSNVREGAATHGCIGLPQDFARRLFEQVRVGDPVVIV